MVEDGVLDDDTLVVEVKVEVGGRELAVDIVDELLVVAELELSSQELVEELVEEVLVDVATVSCELAS